MNFHIVIIGQISRFDYATSNESENRELEGGQISQMDLRREIGGVMATPGCQLVYIWNSPKQNENANL